MFWSCHQASAMFPFFERPQTIQNILSMSTACPMYVFLQNSSMQNFKNIQNFQISKNVKSPTWNAVEIQHETWNIEWNMYWNLKSSPKFKPKSALKSINKQSMSAFFVCVHLHGSTRQIMHIILLLCFFPCPHCFRPCSLFLSISRPIIMHNPMLWNLAQNITSRKVWSARSWQSSNIVTAPLQKWHHMPLQLFLFKFSPFIA